MSALRNMLLTACLGVAACAPVGQRGTLAELQRVAPDIEDVSVDDSLERAAESYRRFLAETEVGPRTPEAMRRLADLQIEQAYGVMGGSQPKELAAPAAEPVPAPARIAAGSAAVAAPDSRESREAFEERASQREILLASAPVSTDFLSGIESGEIPAGAGEAIETYRAILAKYPDYERNDQVLYQMSRAYDEIGQPDEAMQVMDRLVAAYPYSRHIDEVQFRRGEYFFVRKKYLDAELAYGAIIGLGSGSPYYELARYKLGWAFYKQELYEEALHHYIAMLDHRLMMGFGFDEPAEQSDEGDEQHRVADTFRAISLSFSNLGGPEFMDEYFETYGRRDYANRIYSNLGEFYFDKRRFEDAASVYKSFVRLNPFHEESPGFSMRVIEIYDAAGFPQLVVESKKQFATDYAIGAAYWQHFDIESADAIVALLKTNVTDLANHYHALYQDDELAEERGANFSEARHWYREFLVSFSEEPESPQINQQFADLLMQDGDHVGAAREYERTAYDYGDHDKASAAAYAAVYAWRQVLEALGDQPEERTRRAAVSSALRFATVFPTHEQVPAVLEAATRDLYGLGYHRHAIAAGHRLADDYPAADPMLRRSAWLVIAHSSMDLADFPAAEQAYVNVLSLTVADDETRPDVVDGLAASIYQQGEAAGAAGDHRAAAGHFLRVKALAPTSKIRAVAEYDAAASLVQLEDWVQASSVLEDFRGTHPEHELQDEATRQLAFIYRSDGQIERAAAEHERIAAQADDPDLGREALLTAAELYDEAAALDDAIRVYSQYVDQYPRPLDIALESRLRLAEIHRSQSDYESYHAQLSAMIEIDDSAGADRTDRSRYLAAEAALVLAELRYRQFAELRLTQPFEQSLAEKQRRMDLAMEAFERLVPYEVAKVTSAATYYIGEIYFEFSAALLGSERPTGLTAAEQADYEMVIEEEAFPFEERAIEIHQSNLELLAAGVFNDWIVQSLGKLAVLMPGRYAKSETSHGFIQALGDYAYRTPAAQALAAQAQSLAEGGELASGAVPDQPHSEMSVPDDGDS